MIPAGCPVVELRDTLAAHQKSIETLHAALARHMEREENEFARLMRDIAEVLDHVRGHV
jgi:protein-arginine kinase activator protein McsA